MTLSHRIVQFVSNSLTFEAPVSTLPELVGETVGKLDEGVVIELIKKAANL